MEKYFSPQAKQRRREDRTTNSSGDGAGHQESALDVAATKEQAWSKINGMANKIGYPDKWRDYSALKVVRGDAIWQLSSARMPSNLHRQLAKIGKPPDRERMGYDSADGERLLQSADERHQFPRGHFAATVLRSQDSTTLPITATPAESSDTNSPMASTMKAVNSTRKATCATGGRPEDAKEFEKRADCISTQYSNYTIIDDIKINGKRLWVKMSPTSAEYSWPTWRGNRTRRIRSCAAGRAHPRAALLRRLWSKLVRTESRRNQTPARYRRSALSRKIPH